jgi:hypothetical protein
MKDYEERLTELADEIKEADSDHDAELAGKLREEFNALTNHLNGEKGARRRGRKKRCGTPPAVEKADQALRVGLGKLTTRFRKKGLPGLADHLENHIGNAGGEWWYAPPPDTALWQVSP